MTRSAFTFTASIAGAVVLTSLQAGWWLQPSPLAAKCLTAVFVGLSYASPTSALLAFAGLAPFSTVLAELSGATLGGPRLLEQMALACITGALVRHARATNAGTRLAIPTILISVVALASAATLMPAKAAPVPPELGHWTVLLRTFLDGSYAPSDPLWSPLVAALLLVESALLGWTIERHVRDSPALATRLLLMALVAHAGASVLDLYRIVSASMRTGDLIGTLPSRLARARVSMQTDVNASASALLLALISGVGLVSGSWARRVGVSTLMAVTLVGLWVTGSRAALVAGLVGIALGAGWLAVKRGGTARLVAVGCVALMIAGGAWLVAAYPRGRNPTVQHSIESRLILIRAGLQMFTGAPAFGVGIGQFYNLSEAVAGTELASYGQAPRENAHNYFVQTLAEQGLAGLAGLLIALVVVLGGAWRADAIAPNWTRLWLVVAGVACVLTWLTGHPLLVPEFAFVFWLYAGVLAGLTPAAPGNRLRVLAVVAAAAIVLSVPTRAMRARDSAELEHLAFGVSTWQHDDTQRYREAGAAFTLFLPSSDRPNILPIRRAPGVTGVLDVELSIDGRAVARTSLADDDWQDWRVSIPKAPRRFERVDATVRPNAAGASVLVRIGKDALPVPPSAAPPKS